MKPFVLNLTVFFYSTESHHCVRCTLKPSLASFLRHSLDLFQTYHPASKFLLNLFLNKRTVLGKNLFKEKAPGSYNPIHLLVSISVSGELLLGVQY